MTWDGSGSARRRRVWRLIQALPFCSTQSSDDVSMSDSSQTSGRLDINGRDWGQMYLPPGARIPDSATLAKSARSTSDGAATSRPTLPRVFRRPPRFPLAWSLVGMAGCMSLSAPQTTFEPVGQSFVAGSGSTTRPGTGPSRLPTPADSGAAVNLGEPAPADADLGEPMAITPIPRTDRQETSGRRESSSAIPQAPSIPEDEGFPRSSPEMERRTAPEAFGPSADMPDDSPPTLTVPDAPKTADVPDESVAPRPLIELAVANPTERQVGAGATFRVSLTNRSRETLEGMRVVCLFADELQFGTTAEKTVSQSLGSWAARETKDLALTLHSNQVGTFAATFRIERESDGERLAERIGEAKFVDRKYELTVVGPTDRTIGSRAEFTVRIANISTEPLPPAELVLRRDAALVLKELTEGSRRTGGEIRWSLPELAPGAETQFQAEFECRTAADRATVTAQVVGPNGEARRIPEEETEASVRIAPVTGVLDVRLSDEIDPISAGEEGVYRLTITNMGLQEVRRIRVRYEATAPIEMTSVTVKRGSETLTTQFSAEGGALVGDEIDTLPPDATLTLDLRSTARSAGRGEMTAIVEHEVPGSRVEVREPTWVTP